MAEFLDGDDLEFLAATGREFGVPLTFGGYNGSSIRFV